MSVTVNVSGQTCGDNIVKSHLRLENDIFIEVQRIWIGHAMFIFSWNIYLKYKYYEMILLIAVWTNDLKD